MHSFLNRRLVFMLLMFLPGLCTSQMALGCVMAYQWVSSVISLWTTTYKEGTAIISKSFIFSAVEAVHFPPDSSVASHGNSDFQCSWKWRFHFFFIIFLCKSLPFFSAMTYWWFTWFFWKKPSNKDCFWTFFSALSTRILSLEISYFLTGLVTKARFLSQMELIKNKWLKWLWNGEVLKEYLTLFWQTWGLLLWL